MLLPHGTLFAVVDGEHFELYRNAGTEAAPDLAAIEVPSLELTDYSSGGQDHDKVSRLQLGGPIGRLEKLEEAAHASAVAHWLNSEVLAHRIEKLVIIADPRTLGEMRRHYHGKLEEALIGELTKTLTGRKPDEIVEALRAH